MNEFIRFYGWGISMKFHMCMYTLALVFCKGIANALMGVYTVDSLTMLEMMLVSMAVAMVESILFPEHRELSRDALRTRSVWWALLCNLGFLGGAAVFGWFSGVPGWAAVLLVLVLEWGVAAMWFGMHVALKQDTEKLNQRLKDYQTREG